MQQSVSVVHVHSPSLHRLLSATVQPSLNGSAHVLPESTNPPPSPPPEPLQLPVQQSLLSPHGWSTATQQGVLTVLSHTAPFLPTLVVLPVPVLLLEQGSPVAAIERRARARQETRRFIAVERSARSASRTRKADD
jgi:hypothetical protein